MQIEENVSLAPLTTFHIGGPARFLVRIQTVKELQQALSFAKTKNARTLVLGGGSNVLIDDAGFDGLVIKVAITGIEIQKDSKEKAVIIAGAGESWDAVVARSVKENLWGLENLSGIPGTVGGAVAGNIGAYGQALSQTLVWVEVFATEAREIRKMTNEECLFGYRDTFFKRDDGRHILLRAAFELSSVPQPELSYKDLAQQYSSSDAPSLEQVRTSILAIRKGKFPDLSQEGTAGSFFKNPILTKHEAATLKAQYPDMPTFDMPETAGIKIPLGWLFDKVLSLRGFSVGGARLFEKQALVIATTKDATADDVRTLAAVVSV